MEPTFTGRKSIQRDGQDYSAEVTIRFRPNYGSTGVGRSSEAQRYINSRFGADCARHADSIWHSIVNALQAGESRLARSPRRTKANTYRAQVMAVRVSESASADETDYLLAEASREAVANYFAAIDAGQVDLAATDPEQEFEYQPSTGFDEDYISRRQCFLEYVAEKRRGFLFGCTRSQSDVIEESRKERTLTPRGCSALLDAATGYIYGCRPEADAEVALAHELLTLADETDEKGVGGYGSGWGLGQRYTALAYVNWLRTGEPDDYSLTRARKHLLAHYRRTQQFDRRTANLETPALLFLEAYSVLVAMGERVSANPGRGSVKPGGLFGDALAIATAADDVERDRLKAKLRKRMPIQFFRWIHHGHYDDVAFMLHAVFPRPEGPPSRLIERVWDFMPEIERRPEATFGWDIARAKRR